MRSFVLSVLLAGSIVGCAKHEVASSASASHLAPDLAAMQSHLSFIGTQSAATPDGSSKKVDMYSVDMSFDDAKKQIGDELVKEGWQSTDVPQEKGTKSAVFMKLSEGTYSIVAPDTGAQRSCNLMYMAFGPGDVKVTTTP